MFHDTVFKKSYTQKKYVEATKSEKMSPKVYIPKSNLIRYIFINKKRLSFTMINLSIAFQTPPRAPAKK